MRRIDLDHSALLRKLPAEDSFTVAALPDIHLISLCAEGTGTFGPDFFHDRHCFIGRKLGQTFERTCPYVVEVIKIHIASSPDFNSLLENCYIRFIFSRLFLPEGTRMEAESL